MEVLVILVPLALLLGLSAWPDSSGRSRTASTMISKGQGGARLPMTSQIAIKHPSEGLFE